MAKPPGRSLVITGPKPTSAQRARVASLKPAPANPNQRAAALQVGSNLTAARARVSPAGSRAVLTGAAGLHTPAPKTNGLGLYPNPLHAFNPAAGGAAPAAPKPKQPKPPQVKVTVHPNGQVTVHHTASAPEPTGSGAPAGAGAAPAAPRAPKARTKPPAGRAPAAAVKPPLTIEQQAQALLDPVKASILGAINQRTDAEQAAINGYSKDLASMMGQYAPASQAIYGNAEAGQSAVDSALGQTLAGAGQSGQDALAAKLAQIDADPATAARISAQAGANTQGAGGAFAAKGAASLSDLIGRSASAQDYGAKLPGVAGLYGLAATKTAQSKATTDTANAVAQLEQQLPGIANQITTTNNQNKQLRFEHGVALLQANGDVVTPQIKALLGGALPVGATPAAKSNAPKVNTTLSKAYGVQTDDQGNAIIGKDGKPIQYPTGGQSAPKVDLGLSDRYGILVDAQAQPILRNGKPVLLPKKQGAAKTLSGGELSRQTALALGAARTYHTTWTDSKDNSNPALSWQQFLTHGLSAGIDAGVLIKQGKRIYTQREIKLGLIPGQGK